MDALRRHEGISSFAVINTIFVQSIVKYSSWGTWGSQKSLGLVYVSKSCMP